jgi:hypothetical protein
MVRVRVQPILRYCDIAILAARQPTTGQLQGIPESHLLFFPLINPDPRLTFPAATAKDCLKGCEILFRQFRSD